jgi:type II secretory pathway pseudopilin PulG
MRALVDIVQNVTSSIRFVIGGLLVVILLIGFMLSASFAYVAPRAAEAVAERAEKMGEKALEAQERQRVAEDMAQDGWGYSAASATARQGSPEVGETASTDDGWGTN